MLERDSLGKKHPLHDEARRIAGVEAAAVDQTFRAQQIPKSATRNNIQFSIFVLVLISNLMFAIAIPRSTAASGRLRNSIARRSILKRTFCRHSEPQDDSNEIISREESESSRDQALLPLRAAAAPTRCHVSSMNRISSASKAGGTASFCASISRGGGADCSADDLNRDGTYHRAFIAVGSNRGDRYQNIATALKLLALVDVEDTKDYNGMDGLSSPEVKILRTSYLHETAPMYVTAQPAFLNGVVEVETTLSPHALLRRIKSVENRLGRDLQSLVRNGPRPIDLDIIFYGVGYDKEAEHRQSDNAGGWVVDTPDLIVPHARMAEREFVLAPLCDLDADVIHPIENVTVGELLIGLHNKEDHDGAITEEMRQTQQGDSCKENMSAPSAVRVMPLPRGRMLHFNETIVMGILNMTPDSFSDGGKLKGSVDVAAERALQMVEDGAGIIDIGGESTRPGAKEVTIEEEMQRTIPLIKKIRQVSDIPISIDTRHAAVARAAVEAGADIVNDVSGGRFDPDMLQTVAELCVPIVLMHMRGTPETMQSMTQYEDVVSDVATSLLERSEEAEIAGIPRWLQILDPGIGFAKDLNGNLSLLKHAGKLREMARDFPILLGPSRKGFIGRITGESNPEERDFGTAAACVIGAFCGDKNQTGCTILRVHNVRGIKQAAQVMDAIQKLK